MFHLLLALLTTANVHAHTDAKFLGFVGMISLSDTYAGQKVDDDPITLYHLMNVEEKHESMGTGKTIKLSDKSLTVVCTDRSTNDLCTIVVKNNGRGKVSLEKITFQAEGELGEALAQKFFSNLPTGKMEFQTTDKKLKIRTDSSLFTLEYLARP